MPQDRKSKDRHSPSDAASDALKTVRQNLRVALAYRDISQTQASIDAGLSRAAVGQFLRGEASMSFANLAAVCAALDVPVEVIAIPDAITAPKMRAYTLLAQVPAEMAERALQEIFDRTR